MEDESQRQLERELALANSNQEKTEICQQFLERAKNDTQLQASFTKILNSDVIGPQVAQGVLVDMIKSVGNALSEGAVAYFLGQCTTAAIGTVELTILLTLSKARHLQSKQSCKEALDVMNGLQLDSANNNGSGSGWTTIFEAYMQKVELHLQLDDVGSAFHIIQSRARSGLRHVTKGNSDNSNKYLTQFQQYEACCLDRMHKFVEATNLYSRLSFSPNLNDIQRKSALLNATLCIVLAPICPQKSIYLANLYKDSRTRELASYTVLQKMYKGFTVSLDEQTEFGELLQDYHKIPGADLSVNKTEEAFIHHNMYAIARMYKSIHYNKLSALLGISIKKVEAIVAGMLSRDQIRGHIDHEQQLVFVRHHSLSRIAQSQSDKQVMKVCTLANDLAGRIIQRRDK